MRPSVQTEIRASSTSRSIYSSLLTRMQNFIRPNAKIVQSMNLSVNSVLKQSRSLKNKVLICLLFAPFLVNAIRASLRYLDADSLLTSNSISIGISQWLFYEESIVLKAFLYISPIIAITIVELCSRAHLGRAKNINMTSIGRISMSTGHAFADIWYFAIFLIGRLLPVSVFLTLGAGYFVAKYSSSIDSLLNTTVSDSHQISLLSSTFLVVIAVLVTDFTHYWRHRLEHQFNFLWQFHEFHHSATEMTILSNHRNTPIAGLFTFPVTTASQVFCSFLIAKSLTANHSLPVVLYIIYGIISQSFRYLSHSSLYFVFNETLSKVFMSPSLHWIHHSSNPRHFNSNFSMVFVFWDKLFGTYKGSEELSNIYGFGIAGSKYNKISPIDAACVEPIRRLFSSLLKTNFRRL